MSRSFRIKRPGVPKQSEHKLQVTVIQYLNVAGRKDLHWTAIPNGGYRSKLTAAKLKAEGVRAGTPDIMILLPNGQTGFLELKTTKGRLGPAQEAFRDICGRLGIPWAMARSLDETVRVLRLWGVLKPEHDSARTFFKTDHLESIKHDHTQPAKEVA